MKGVLKTYLYLLFELLVIPLVFIFALYLVYLRKVRPIKLMDKFFNFLIKIEDKLQKL